MKLAVYLPALNEAQTIGELLDAMPTAPGVTSLVKIARLKFQVGRGAARLATAARPFLTRIVCG